MKTKNEWENLYEEKYDKIEDIAKDTLEEMYLYGGVEGGWAKDIYLCEDGEIYVTGAYSSTGSTVVQNAVFIVSIESWNAEDDESFFDLSNYSKEDIEALKEEIVLVYDDNYEEWTFEKPIPRWVMENSDVIDWIMRDEYNNNRNPLLPASLFEEELCLNY